MTAIWPHSRPTSRPWPRRRSTISCMRFSRPRNACRSWAVIESARYRGTSRPVVIHTGFWGCGAFGGNRVLMTLLQAMAAEMAGIDRLVFHTGDASGTTAFQAAQQVIARDLNGPRGDIAPMIDRIAAMGFEWGMSDGN